MLRRLNIDVEKHPNYKKCDYCGTPTKENETVVKIVLNGNKIYYHQTCASTTFKNLHNYIERHKPLKEQHLI